MSDRTDPASVAIEHGKTLGNDIAGTLTYNHSEACFEVKHRTSERQATKSMPTSELDEMTPDDIRKVMDHLVAEVRSA